LHLHSEVINTLLSILNDIWLTFLLVGVIHMWCQYQNQEKTH